MPLIGDEPNVSTNSDSSSRSDCGGCDLHPSVYPLMNKSLLKREPAVVIGSVLAAINAVVAIVSTATANLPEHATWYQVLLSVFLVAGPVLQGKLTRERVFSPASVEKEVPVV